jgi:hypothetical protein
VHIFCEGQTESNFVYEALLPHFTQFDVLVNAIVLSTSLQQKGGITTFGKLKYQIVKKCKEDPTSWVTTFIDMYGLPSDFPGLSTHGNLAERRETILSAFKKEILMPNFVPNIIIHEYEGLLFSDPESFSIFYKDKKVVDALTKIRYEHISPEHINSGVNTAPSKRIISICNKYMKYNKVAYGVAIANKIGLDKIRKECVFFDQWLKTIESIR